MTKPQLCKVHFNIRTHNGKTEFIDLKIITIATNQDPHSINVPIEIFDALVGHHGSSSRRPYINGGAVYTRWGQNKCPGTEGTELVYSGYAGGSGHNHHGGGADYLCLPEVAEYYI